MKSAKDPRTWIWVVIGAVQTLWGLIRWAWHSLVFVATVQSMPTDLAAFSDAWIVPLASRTDKIDPWAWVVIGMTIIVASFLADHHWDKIAAAIRKHDNS